MTNMVYATKTAPDLSYNWLVNPIEKINAPKIDMEMYHFIKTRLS